MPRTPGNLKTGTVWKGAFEVERERNDQERVRETRADKLARSEGFHRLTDLLRCKWTLAIIDAIDRGVTRPGQLQRELPGLTAKILNERVRKLESYGLIDRHAYPEIPPRVEFSFTERGRDLIGLIRTMRAFAEQWDQSIG